MKPRYWTINALAVELNIDRRTVAKRLKGVPAHGRSESGHPGYLLDEVLGILRPPPAGQVPQIDGFNYSPPVTPGSLVGREDLCALLGNSESELTSMTDRGCPYADRDEQSGLPQSFWTAHVIHWSVMQAQLEHFQVTQGKRTSR